MKARTEYAYVARRMDTTCVHERCFAVTHSPSGRGYIYRPDGRVFSTRACRYLSRTSSTGRACAAAVDRLLIDEGVHRDDA